MWQTVQNELHYFLEELHKTLQLALVQRGIIADLSLCQNNSSVGELAAADP